jgi:hypothetical protein
MVKMSKSTINLWRNKQAGYFGKTKTATSNPNTRKGAIYPWTPVVNYRRVNFTDNAYKVREYSQGVRVWRECANHELHRYARELSDLKIAKYRNKLIVEKAIQKVKEKNLERNTEEI